MTALRRARNQALFREVNDRIRELAPADGLPLEFLCECASRACIATVPLPASEYDAIRAVPTRFLLRPDHVGNEDAVVAELDGVVIVEKAGVAADVVRRAAGGPSAGS